MLPSLENDPEVLLDVIMLLYHINMCIIQFYLIMFYKLCVIIFQDAENLMIWLAMNLV